MGGVEHAGQGEHRPYHQPCSQARNRLKPRGLLGHENDRDGGTRRLPGQIGQVENGQGRDAVQLQLLDQQNSHGHKGYQGVLPGKSPDHGHENHNRRHQDLDALVLKLVNGVIDHRAHRAGLNNHADGAAHNQQQGNDGALACDARGDAQQGAPGAYGRPRHIVVGVGNDVAGGGVHFVQARRENIGQGTADQDQENDENQHMGHVKGTFRLGGCLGIC